MIESLEDIELLKRAQQRDRQAFTELFQRHQTAAYNLALHFLHDSALAEDAVQDAMLSLWSSNKPVPHDANVRGWILSLVTTRSLNLLRQRKRQARREEIKAMDRKSAANVSETLEDNEMVDALRLQLGKLPEHDSHLLACHYVASMSHSRIAETLGISRSTVSERIQQALARLRLNLKQAGIAAALPLIDGDGIFSALTMGSQCPPGMTERMLLRIEGVTTGGAGSLANPASGISRKTGLIAAAVVLTAGATLLLAGNALTGSVSPAAAPAAAPGKSAAFARSWNFNDAEQAREFRVTYGSWRFVPGGSQDKTGCMATEGGTFIMEIDLPTGKLPLKMTMDLKPLAPRVALGHVVGARWNDTKRARFNRISYPTLLNEGTWYPLRIHVTKNFIENWMGGERKSFAVMERGPTSKLTLYMRGKHCIDNLTIREISDEDVPDAGNFLSALSKIDPSKRAGEVVVPELKAAKPSEQVTITFELPDSSQEE